MYKIMVTGHRIVARPNVVKLELLEFVQSELEVHPDLVLVSGMAIGTDTWFAQIAVKLDLPLHAYIPFPKQSDRWKKAARDEYRSLLGYAGCVDVCCDTYSNAAYLERNQRMVDVSDACVAVWSGDTRSGTGNAVRKARNKGIDVTVINPSSMGGV